MTDRPTAHGGRTDGRGGVATLMEALLTANCQFLPRHCQFHVDHDLTRFIHYLNRERSGRSSTERVSSQWPSHEEIGREVSCWLLLQQQLRHYSQTRQLSKARSQADATVARMSLRNKRYVINTHKRHSFRAPLK